MNNEKNTFKKSSMDEFHEKYKEASNQATANWIEFMEEKKGLSVISKDTADQIRERYILELNGRIGELEKKIDTHSDIIKIGALKSALIHVSNDPDWAIRGCYEIQLKDRKVFITFSDFEVVRSGLYVRFYSVLTGMVILETRCDNLMSINKSKINRGGLVSLEEILELYNARTEDLVVSVDSAIEKIKLRLK
jgi:hypothetical protein